MPRYVLWIFFLAMMKARGELPFIPENNAAMMVNWNAVEENKKLYAIYDTSVPKDHASLLQQAEYSI